MVDERGYLRLADMGLSKVLGVGKDHVRTSTVCGTRAYLAPEMVLRKPYGYSVDFWQFGCFLFELYAVSQSKRLGPGSMLPPGTCRIHAKRWGSEPENFLGNFGFVPRFARGNRRVA